LVGGGPTGATPLVLSDELTGLGYEQVGLRSTADRQLYLPARIENRRAVCIVDTGWSFTTISAQAAASVAGSNQISLLKLDRLVLTNIPVRVAAPPVAGQQTSYELVLGAAFLSRHHAWLDLAGKKMFLHEATPANSLTAELHHRLRRAGWREVELERRQPAAWTVDAKLGTRDFRMLLDTGAPWSCLDFQSACHLGIPVHPSLTRMSGPRLPVQPIQVTPALELDFGDIRAAQVRLAVFSLQELGLGPTGKLFPDVTGILGAAELTRHQAVVDCGGDRIWWRPKSRIN
jgi:predicted aspartyl protease